MSIMVMMVRTGPKQDVGVNRKMQGGHEEKKEEKNDNGVGCGSGCSMMTRRIGR